MPESKSEARWMDFIIRVALIFTLVVLCVRIALPFLSPAMWGIVLAVALRLIQSLALRGARSGTEIAQCDGWIAPAPKL